MAVLYLLLSIVVLVVTIVAMTRIITKAGYSPFWVFVVLAPPLLAWITEAVVIHDVRGTFGTVNLTSVADTAGALAILDFLAVVTAWIFFLIFAFSDWPALRTIRNSRPEASAAASFLPGPAPAPGPWRPPPPTAPPTAQPAAPQASAGSPVPGPGSVATAPPPVAPPPTEPNPWAPPLPADGEHEERDDYWARHRRGPSHPTPPPAPPSD